MKKNMFKKVLSWLCFLVVCFTSLLMIYGDNKLVKADEIIQAKATLSVDSLKTTDEDIFVLTLSYANSPRYLFCAGARVIWNSDVFEFIGWNYNESLFTDYLSFSKGPTPPYDVNNPSENARAVSGVTNYMVLQAIKTSYVRIPSGDIGTIMFKIKDRETIEEDMGELDTKEYIFDICHEPFSFCDLNSDGVEATYEDATLTVTKPSTECDLNKLEISNISGLEIVNGINPTEEVPMSVLVPNTTTSLTFDSTVSVDSTVLHKLDDSSVQYKLGTGAYTNNNVIEIETLSTMSYILKIKVTAENGINTKEYTLNITRDTIKDIGDLDKDNLKILNGETKLAGTWNDNTYIVTEEIPYASKDNIFINATNTGENSVLTISNELATKSVNYLTKNVIKGLNLIEVKVTPEDGNNAKFYYVEFKVTKPNSDVTLNSITIKDNQNEVIKSITEVDTFNYQVIVPADVTSITFETITNALTSVVSGYKEIYDLSVTPLPLEVKLTVQSEANTKMSYTINLIKEIEVSEGITTIFLVESGKDINDPNTVKYEVKDFDPSNLQYTIEILKDDAKSYKLMALCGETYEVVGNVDVDFKVNSETGETECEVILIDKEMEETVRIYNVNVKNKEQENFDSNTSDLNIVDKIISNTDNKMLVYVLGGITGLFLVGFIITLALLIVLKKRLKKSIS